MTWNDFGLATFIWMSATALSWLKVMYDNQMLLKLYRKEVNPPFRLRPYEFPGVDFPDRPDPYENNYWASSKRLLSITFKKTGNPKLEAAAKKVRYGILLTLVIVIVGFLVVVAIG